MILRQQPLALRLPQQRNGILSSDVKSLGDKNVAAMQMQVPMRDPALKGRIDPIAKEASLTPSIWGTEWDSGKLSV